jgi:MFS family permease
MRIEKFDEIKVPGRAARTAATCRSPGQADSEIIAAFLVVMAFSAAPAPLYPLYQQRDHFSTFMVTVVFAVYAVGVVISLLLVGHLSDTMGRKRILIPAVGVGIATQFVMATTAVYWFTGAILALLAAVAVLLARTSRLARQGAR